VCPFGFYAELNDHFPSGQRYGTVEKDFFVLPASVNDMIEGFGVPHTGVDLILVNGLFDWRSSRGVLRNIPETRIPFMLTK